MFMRFIGDGIGHQATDYIKQVAPEGPEPAPASEMVPESESQPYVQEDAAKGTVDDAEAERRGPDHNRDDADEGSELEEVNTDEEMDFGYAGDADGEVSEEEEAEPEDEDNDDNFAEL